MNLLKLLAGAVAAAVVLAEDLFKGVYAPVHCDDCRLTRARIKAAEVEPLIVEGQLPCPCGSIQTYVGGSGLSSVGAKGGAW